MGGSASTSKSLAVAPLVEAVKSGGDEDKQKAARIVADFADSDHPATGRDPKVIASLLKLQVRIQCSVPF